MPAGITDSSHPESVGPYKVVELLGEGGMGVVYRAVQESPIRREVALKVIKLGMDTREVVGRFEAERQTLALMDHPAIAKVYDAGATEEGRPFFAMELVDGVLMHEYCDAHRLTVRQRVALFVDVCLGIQHAHQRGIIHRDLKPSNVLIAEVDGQPVPKVIDFGIARAVDPGPSDSQVTRLGEMVGTPAYMSPEQAEGGGADLDVRADVYSLGVMLYEILAGSLPFSDEQLSRGGLQLLAALLSGELPRPSARLARIPDTQQTIAELRRTRVDVLRRDLNGELDWIVMRAMEAERERRYQSVGDLARDLRAFLNHEPVEAKPPTIGYRARKFVRRHRWPVALAAAGLAGLIAFAGITAVKNAQVTRARDEADARRDQAEQLIDFMLGDLREKLEPIGRLDVLADVGEQAIRYFSSLPEEQFSDSELQNRSQSLYQIGSVRLDQGDTDGAVVAFDESLRMAQFLAERDSSNVERLFGLSQSHFYVGYAAWLNADLDRAEAEFDEYLELAERLASMDPVNLDYQLEVGYAHSNIGSVREARGDLQGAVESFLRTLDAKESLVRADPDNIDWVGELAEEHNKLAVIYRKQGRFREALDGHQRELEIKQRALSLEPSHAYWNRRLAWAHNFLARTHHDVGELSEADLHSRRAVDVMFDLAANDPTNAAVRRNLATMQTGRAEVLIALGDHDQALQSLRAAEVELQAQLASDSTRLSLYTSLAQARRVQALLWLDSASPRAALDAAEAAGEIIRPVRDDDDRAMSPSVASTLLVLGWALDAVGRKEEAVEAWEDALSRVEGLMTEPGGGEFRALRAEVLLALDRLSDAERDLQVLREQGYRRTRLLELAERKGIRLTSEP